MAFYNDIPLEMAKTLYENYFSLLKYDIGQDFYLFHQVGPDIRGTIVSDDELEIINFLNKNKFISNSICSINVKNESKLFYVLGSKTEQSERFFTGWKYKTLDNARKVVKFLIKTKIFFASVCCINIKERKLFYVFYQEETNPEDVTWTYKQFDSVDKVFNFLNNNEFINVSVCPINNKESISFIVFYLLQKKSSNINLSFKCFNSSEKLNEFINRKNSHLIKPFGNKPKILDTFYIGSNDAFSKKGAKILLNIRRDHPYPSGTKEEPSLSWEYWNGNSWTAIRDLNDNTENFTAESMKTAEFLCPADIESNTVNGQENFWIRVRIVDGTFGEFLEYDPLNEIFKYDPKTLYPPKITELNIQYEYLKFQALEYCLSFNNLEFKDFSEEIKAGNKPFIKTDDKHQTIYFGFDQKLEKGPINLFFDIEEYPWISNDQTLKWEYYNENGDWTGFDALDGTYGFTRSGTVEFYIPKDFIKTRKFGKELYWIRAVDVNYKFQSSREEFEIKLAQLINTYDENPDVIPPELPKMLKLADVYNIKTIKNPSYAGNALLKSESENKLKIKDNREILNEIVLDKISINLEKKEISISKLEDQINPCVSEIELDHPEWSSSKLESFNPHIRGIYLNTTWGVQWETIKDEILGSSDGTEMQTFKLLKNTVISEELWVNEINSISEAEIQKIKEKNEFKVIETKDEKGNLTEFWVNWKPVDDILLAENERFYEIDHYSGELKFGNEISGKIPPIGRNNLKITYRTGGGSKGNLPVNEIKDLKSSIAFVDKAYNPLPAGGGSDVEDISNLLDRGPKILKNRNRAVTTEDFEEITRQASREVAKVKCLSNFDNKGEISSGWVTLLVIPQSEEEKPVLSFGLKNRIEEYLHDHAANTLNLQVSAPLYVSVSTTVTLKTESARIVPQVEKETFKTLSQFLNPLKGGYNSRGWDFGKMPCISDFYSILEKIEGIDHVSELSVLFKTDQGDEYPLEPGKMADFQLTPYCMIYSGEHLVKVEPGDDV